MNETPLKQAHEELGARMVDFGGWYLPVQYNGIVAEHESVRNKCGIFDTCHMGRVLVKGDNAGTFLSSALTVDAANMPEGRCRYGFMLNSDAGIIDDLIVYRMSPTEYMVVINSATHDKDIGNLESQMIDGVELEDISSTTGKIDIQGPEASSVTEKALKVDLSGLKYFRCMTCKVNGNDVIVSRTGYTGEDGFEVYAPSQDIVQIWSAAIDAGAAPCGLGARDTLRLESGLPLYGHEMTEETSPLEAGFMKYIDLKRDFTGAEKLRQQSTDGPKISLTAFKIDGRQSARHGNRVIINGNDAGWVTSGSFAPSLGHSVGFAYIDSSAIAGTSSFNIDNGRKLLDALVTEAPFYSK